MTNALSPSKRTKDKPSTLPYGSTRFQLFPDISELAGTPRVAWDKKQTITKKNKKKNEKQNKTKQNKTKKNNPKLKIDWISPIQTM